MHKKFVYQGNEGGRVVRNELMINEMNQLLEYIQAYSPQEKEFATRKVQ